MANYPDTKIIPVAQTLLECLCTEAILNPKPPAICGFRTGTEGSPLGGSDPGSDECCHGAAFVRVIRTYPSWNAPNVSGTSIRCAQPIAVEMELSMWRCVPTGDMGTPPGQPQWNQVHEDLLNDRVTLQAAACCFLKTRDNGSVMVGEWTIDNTSGGCVGSILPIQIDLYGRS